MIDLLCLDGLLNTLCFSLFGWVPLDPCRFGAVVDDNVNEDDGAEPAGHDVQKGQAKHIGGATAGHDYCTKVMASRESLPIVMRSPA